MANYMYFAAVTPPISEAVVDHDYALLALKKCGDTTRDLWSATVSAMRKLDAHITEPIKNFINVDLKNFKVDIDSRPTSVTLVWMDNP